MVKKVKFATVPDDTSKHLGKAEDRNFDTKHKIEIRNNEADLTIGRYFST